ncbi:MAG: glycosyltransferase [Bacteroidales bacterium]|nr:glycosyltransferase [Bacteroidales bacterium]
MVLDIYDSQDPQKEVKIAKKIEGVILPSDQRLEQVGFDKKDVKNYIEIENVPVIKQAVSDKDKVEFPQLIHLTYVGIFQKSRGLENLIQFALCEEKVVLDIAGIGGGLDEMVKGAAAKTNRIRYYGKVDYTKALELMSECDFLVALYYLSDKDHKYASPNKYYESLALGKPIITSKNTLVGNNVERYNTGYVIEDDLVSLQNVFKCIRSEDFMLDYLTKKKNCKSRWDNFYSSYFENKLKKDYFEFIEKAKLL